MNHKRNLLNMIKEFKKLSMTKNKHNNLCKRIALNIIYLSPFFIIIICRIGPNSAQSSVYCLSHHGPLDRYGARSAASRRMRSTFLVICGSPWNGAFLEEVDAEPPGYPPSPKNAPAPTSCTS